MTKTFLAILGLAVTSTSFAGTTTPALQTQLIQACQQPFSTQTQTSIQLLLKQGADLNSPDQESGTSEMGPVTLQNTCMGVAAAAGDLDLLNFILASGAKVLSGNTAVTEFGVTQKTSALGAIDQYLSSAMESGTEDQAKPKAVQMANVLVPVLLKELKSTPQPTGATTAPTVQSAFSFSVQVGASDAVKATIAAGAKVNSLDGSDHSALELAVGKNDVQMVQILLQHGATAACIGSVCPILSAVWTDNVSLVQMLLQHGASAKTANNEGEYALNLAARSANPSLELIQTLVAAGADPKAVYLEKTVQNQPSGDVTPLISTIIGVVQGPLGNRAQIVEYLLRDQKVDPNAGCEWSMTAMGLAQNYKEDAVVTLLQQYGADPKVTACTAK